MHLGIIDGPFVPPQEIPIPLPKVQMAPRLKILMSSGSKKGTLIYYSFLSRVPSSESPPGSRTEPLWREMPVSRAFLDILPGFPVKEPSLEALRTEPLQRETLHSYSHLHPSLKVPGRWAPFQVPRRGPYGKRWPSPEPFLPILQGPQQGTPPSRFPSRGSHRERRSISKARVKGHPLSKLQKVSGTRWRWGMLC